MAHNNSVPPEKDDIRTPEPPPKDVQVSRALMNDAVNRVPGDVVNKATANLPDAHRSAIRRLHAYYAENNLTLDEIGKLIRMDRASVSLIFRNKYPARLDNAVKEIEIFFDLLAKRNEGRKLQFIENSLSKRIWQICDLAREFQKIAFLFGDSHIGKSESLVNYRDTHNHGSTVYSEMPTGGALINYLHHLAKIMRIPTSLSVTELRERVIAAFDDRMLLIVDEAHQCIRESGKLHLPILTIEFIRELFNRKKCGVVICATNVFRTAMEDPESGVERVLRQTRRRRLCTLQLPNVPSRADLNTFAAAYGLAPAEGKALELQTRMVEEEALGMWLTLLRMAGKLAAQRKQDMSWDHVIKAHAGLMELERLAA